MDQKTPIAPPCSVPEDPKRQAILAAAFEVFVTYGFRRSSMEDIARAANMSRPALYLHFRNKEDMFRSLVEGYYDGASAAMAEALAGQGTPEEVLLAAFRAKDTEAMSTLLASPHGAELLDPRATSSGDLIEAGEARLRAHLADWLRAGQGAGRFAEGIVEDPDALAGAMLAALKGLKVPGTPMETYRSGQEQLARLFGRALTPG
ncbi:MAG TPA: TetR/AcrR family transcriptional regulator [Aliiroseovarius sp.]|nr:TetR/AcrR family transcriptional regulator [Aliiroseovarius sp.]